MKPELLQLLELAESACGAAGRTILTFKEGRKGTREKPDDLSLVTDADMAAHDEIRRTLSVSSIAVVSEEDATRTALPAEAWIVDPLDGTTNFSRGIPLFSVSVALVSGGEVAVGVVYAPCTGEIFSAAIGHGMRVNGRPLHLPDGVTSPKRLAFVNHGYDPKDAEEARQVATAVGRGFSLRCLGTSALELAYVAAGRADVFITVGDKLWDYAAGLILARESGRIVTDWSGKARPALDTPQLLAATAASHPVATDLLRGSFRAAPA